MNDKDNKMHSKTRIALHAFIVAYRRHTGKRLTEIALLADKDQLRSALEDALARNEPELYRVTEGLVLALRAEPLPAAA